MQTKVIITAAPADSGVFKHQNPAVPYTEDNVRMPNGELARGSWEQVEMAVKIASCLGREPATPDEARKMLGLKISKK